MVRGGLNLIVALAGLQTADGVLDGPAEVAIHLDEAIVDPYRQYEWLGWFVDADNVHCVAELSQLPSFRLCLAG